MTELDSSIEALITAQASNGSVLGCEECKIQGSVTTIQWCRKHERFTCNDCISKLPATNEPQCMLVDLSTYGTKKIQESRKKLEDVQQKWLAVQKCDVARVETSLQALAELQSKLNSSYAKMVNDINLFQKQCKTLAAFYEETLDSMIKPATFIATNGPAKSDAILTKLCANTDLICQQTNQYFSTVRATVIDNTQIIKGWDDHIEITYIDQLVAFKNVIGEVKLLMENTVKKCTQINQIPAALCDALSAYDCSHTWYSFVCYKGSASVLHAEARLTNDYVIGLCSFCGIESIEESVIQRFLREKAIENEFTENASLPIAHDAEVQFGGGWLCVQSKRGTLQVACSKNEWKPVLLSLGKNDYMLVKLYSKDD